MISEFRAWDKCRKIMITEYRIPYYDDVYGVLLNDVFNDSHVILEQYTGLKDINGNKIFEDDIVRNEHEKTCVVNFKEGSFLVGDFYFGSIGAGMGLEIIGNIHENPELLEVEK